MDTSILLGTHRPRAADDANTMMSLDELETLLEAKRARVRAGDCLQPVVVRRGNVCTEQGLLVNEEQALAVVLQEEDRIKKRKRRRERRRLKESRRTSAFNRRVTWSERFSRLTP